MAELEIVPGRVLVSVGVRGENGEYQIKDPTEELSLIQGIEAARNRRLMNLGGTYLDEAHEWLTAKTELLLFNGNMEKVQALVKIEKARHVEYFGLDFVRKLIVELE